MIVIDARYFYAAVVLEHGVVKRCAPILHYMRGWAAGRVLSYCRGKHWQIVEYTA